MAQVGFLRSSAPLMCQRYPIGRISAGNETARSQFARRAAISTISGKEDGGGCRAAQEANRGQYGDLGLSIDRGMGILATKWDKTVNTWLT